MGRAPCCDKENVKKGPWSPEEDAKLKEFIGKYGTGGNWIALPSKAGLKRCGKSCRLRWLNYLRPNIRHGVFSDDEDRIICNLYASIGSRWSVIAAQLSGRTDNDIKNHWNTKLKKKLLIMPPSLQEKQTLFSSMPFQPPPYDHTSQQFLNNSSSYYTFTPNFMNVDKMSNSFVHINDVTPLQSSSPPLANNLMSNNSVDVNDNCLKYLESQDDHDNNPMLMFGSTCSSYEDGNYNKDHEQKQKYHIKQEDYHIPLDDHILGDQVQIRSLPNNLEDVKQLINLTSYLFHDDDENKRAHYY